MDTAAPRKRLVRFGPFEADLSSAFSPKTAVAFACKTSRFSIGSARGTCGRND